MSDSESRMFDAGQVLRDLRNYKRDMPEEPWVDWDRVERLKREWAKYDEELNDEEQESL